jgi:hypothetical protein
MSTDTEQELGIDYDAIAALPCQTTLARGCDIPATWLHVARNPALHGGVWRGYICEPHRKYWLEHHDEEWMAAWPGAWTEFYPL